MNDKMREEFEAAYTAYVSAKHGAESAMNPEWLDKNSNGEYRSYHAAGAWWGWQASRESLVVELPDDGIEDCRKEWPQRGEKYGYDTFDTGYLYACKKHEEAIESLGLRVK